VIKKVAMFAAISLLAGFPAMAAEPGAYVVFMKPADRIEASARRDIESMKICWKAGLCCSCPISGRIHSDLAEIESVLDIHK